MDAIGSIGFVMASDTGGGGEYVGKVMIDRGFMV